ncbi:L-idonate 5-dehydrogenase [Halotalea alkalilenta]|uniref:L-idonate 5-dehydrogenase n=1 Tax=Halotalea alkalilenta TaxID=376489 RepID=A0A172YCN9_9GAMM|nr:L-idonate 5-dehydrogenase [Halotalea alkalilenta]ANF56886.1 L-idonate 5-dehydrogenase [Halotalea alkalilenta]
MKAVTIHAPRDLRIDDIEAGSPGPGQVEVRIRNGGICGSDLHYYQHGGFGAVRIKQPMILGHEIVGEVLACGENVDDLAPGTPVAINPGFVPAPCKYSREGLINHALEMRFYGSAMRMPHVHGGFRQRLVCERAQIVPLPEGLGFEKAAFAEPLAVCLHAARQAGDLLGKRVLVSGAGPIGALTTMVAKLAGARELVVTDLLDAPLATVAELGATRTINVMDAAGKLDEYKRDKGHFDVVFECSGSAPGLATALEVARPRATIVQVGMGNDVQVPLSILVVKEISLRGTFRFIEEFEAAVATLGRDDFDVAPLLTQVLPVERAVEAFELAGDKRRSMKVQLSF